jgi:CubicO group peptidase (beta-lactamase class C family)
LIAAVPWYFIISGNLETGGFDLFGSGGTEESMDEPEPPPYEEPEPPPYEEPEPPPEDEPEPPPMHVFPHEDTVVDIRTFSPEIFRELTEVSNRINAMAVSLVLFDGDTGEYFTFEHGNADAEERRAVNTDTKFRVASLAKLTTVICVMVLVDEGLIDLDTDISIYLGYEVLNVHHPGTAITARMLMQHNSSIFDSGAFTVSRDRNTSESVRFLLDRGTSFRRNEPGTNFEYSNFGYSVLGAICENVSGKSLDTLARDVLFRPLGIDAAYVPENLYDTENIAVIYNETHVITRSVLSQLSVTESGVLGDDVHLAQGNLTISAIDYARIITMLGNGGILHGIRILSQEAVSEMHVTNVEGDGYEQGLGTRFSEGGFITGEGFYWHTGSGYGLLAQYLYSAATTDNRGTVVVFTGAISSRESNGMISVCNELSRLAWSIWDIIDQVPGEEETGHEDDIDGD